MLTSCILPSLMWMKVGILPRRSSSVCSLTAALGERKGAHENVERRVSTHVFIPSTLRLAWQESAARRSIQLSVQRLFPAFANRLFEVVPRARAVELPVTARALLDV